MFGKLFISKNGVKLDFDGAMYSVLSIKGAPEGFSRMLYVKIIKASANFVEALNKKQLVVIELPRKETQNG